jgi:hypothetical protein
MSGMQKFDNYICSRNDATIGNNFDIGFAPGPRNYWQLPLTTAGVTDLTVVVKQTRNRIKMFYRWNVTLKQSLTNNCEENLQMPRQQAQRVS